MRRGRRRTAHARAQGMASPLAAIECPPSRGRCGPRDIAGAGRRNSVHARPTRCWQNTGRSVRFTYLARRVFGATVCGVAGNPLRGAHHTFGLTLAFNQGLLRPNTRCARIGPVNTRSRRARGCCTRVGGWRRRRCHPRHRPTTSQLVGLRILRDHSRWMPRGSVPHGCDCGDKMAGRPRSSHSRIPREYWVNTARQSCRPRFHVTNDVRILF